MFSHQLLTLCKEDVEDFKDEEPASSKAQESKPFLSVCMPEIIPAN